MSPATTALLIDVIAGMLEGLGRVAVGASSPIPAAAAMLARERGGGRPAISLLGAQAGSDMTDGGRELFDRAGQGRIDAFFLGGVQIDGGANINLVGTGPHPAADKRFPGSYGSAYLYFVVPRVILFRGEHTPRTLVRKVDFVSAPGTSPPEVYRPGGPYALVTGRCVFRFDGARGRFRLASLHPGHDLDDVRAATGFDFDCDEDPPTTATPSDETMALIRGPIGKALAELYPRFAAALLDGKRAT
ncbi:MAG: CoA synthetase [Rhodospirillales bacterium]|nr:CoA synthetase [Rhodospirillales bacterium]MDE0381737.1 CoA synthetase [Rhodospirillales bacterium]